MFKKSKVLTLVLALVMILSLLIVPVGFAAESDDVVIDILSINDFHGSLQESGKNIGMAKLVKIVDMYKGENRNTLVVSAGDNYQGSAMSNLTYGEPVGEMLEMMGVIASAVGNHEFDWGTDRIPTYAEQGGFEFLATNIYDKATDEPVSWALPYIVEEVGGKQIAFIGLTTLESEYKTKAENVEDLTFKDPAEAAQVWVDYLLAGKDEAGVPDAIIALTHMGADQDSYGTDITAVVSGEITELSMIEGIDAIITGHNHSSVAGYTESGVPVVQGYKYGRALANLELVFASNGDLSIIPKIDLLYADGAAEAFIYPDIEAQAAYDEWNIDLEPILEEVLGVATDEFAHGRYEDYVSVLGRWVCESMAAETGTQIAIQNGGGLRREIPKGDVTAGILYEVMPFDNTLVTMNLNGADLIKNIEHCLGNEDVGNGSFSGLIVEFNPSLEFGNRITNITLADGTPIDSEAEYSLVINDFMYPTGDNFMFENGTDVVDTFVPIRDLLVNTVKAQETITPQAIDYVTIVE